MACVSMGIKIRIKFIEMKYCVSYGLVIFIINNWQCSNFD